MNEQDLIIQEKIKKREKTDIMLAYAMIVILVICILIVVYLKFIRKEDNSTSNNDNNQTEYTVNYIKLDDIASGISSNLSSKYSGINASVSDNSINVTYGDLLYDIKLINNELEFIIDNDNKDLSEDIYKEIIATVCTFYSNDRTGCVNASKEIDNNTNGVRFIDNNVYISITSGVSPMDVIEKTTYTVETITDIDNTNYDIQMNNKIINNIKVDMNDTEITISGDISSSGKVTVKLYDIDEKLLEEKSSSENNDFSISFDYDDKLNIDNIKKYSISIE